MLALVLHSDQYSVWMKIMNHISMSVQLLKSLSLQMYYRFFYGISSDNEIVLKMLCYLITRRRSFTEYWKYFVACFNDVHAFGYNFAGSEWIWMKFGELRVYCLELSLTDFGRAPRRSESRRPCGRFLSGKQHTTADFRSANFHEICTQNMVLSGGECFWKHFLKI